MTRSHTLARSVRQVLRSSTYVSEESLGTAAGRIDALEGPSSFSTWSFRGISRFSTLVSWGVNGSGECGVSQNGGWDSHVFTSLVRSPTEVLDGFEFSSVSAGLTHGAVVVSDGTVFTFGKGSHGELGTGRMDPVLEASRVEHLVGHHRIRSVAAGRTCTWFLNEEGNVLGCGTYAAGSEHGMFDYLGYGGSSLSPLSSLSSGSSNPLNAVGSMDEDDGLDEVGSLQIFSGGSGGRQGLHQQGIGMMDAYGNFMRENVKPSTSTQHSAHHHAHSLQHFIPFIDHRARSMELQQSKYMFSDPLRNLSEIDSAQRLWDDMSELSCFSENMSLPTPVGGAGLMGRVVGSSQNLLNRNSIQSLSVCLYSGRTLAINSEGMPVVVEPLKPTRALQMDSMLMPASWAQSSMPPPIVLSTVEDNGGAVKAVVGEDWYGVLCRDGRVVVWWREMEAGCGAGGRSDRPSPRSTLTPSTSGMSSSASMKAKRSKVKTIKKGNSVFCTQDGTTVTTLAADAEEGIREISASPGGLYVSDGRRVWRLSLPSKQRLSAIAGINMQRSPGQMSMDSGNLAEQVMDVGEGCIKKMDVNARGTVAAVTDSGHLWLLGDVVSEKDLSYVVGKSDERRGRVWEGLRSVDSQAVLVPGLHGVRDVSLGEHHVLAVVA